MIRIFTTALLLCATFVHAETFTWEDANGLHFTDDAAKVPARYKKKSRGDMPNGHGSSVQRQSVAKQREHRTESVTANADSGEDWSRYVRFTPPPGYEASAEPGNGGFPRTGVVYRKRSSRSGAQISLAFMDGIMVAPDKARQSGFPELTIDALLEEKRKEMKGTKGLSVYSGYLAGRRAAIVSGKPEGEYAGENLTIKRYQVLCGNSIFEATIVAESSSELQELDRYVQQIELTYNCD